MLRRIAESLQAIWARISKPPELPLRPMDSLNGHLRHCRETALSFSGISPRAIRTEDEVKDWLLAIDLACDFEEVAWKQEREVIPCTTPNPHGGGRIYCEGHRDVCNGWENQPAFMDSGPEVLQEILDALEYAKTDHSAGAWGTFSWSAEHCGDRWLHYHKVIVQQHANGGHRCAHFHFYVTVIGDLL
ncbi:MAG: hypothetical protein WCP91_00680 [Candidatus Berkelbacteria bacterium]